MTPVQSYKKVLNFAPISRAAAFQSDNVIVTGADSIAQGQTSPTDNTVATGSKISFIEIQIALVNLVSVSCFTHIIIQHLHSGQSVVGANVVGGNPQRNQVFHQDLFNIGQDQNLTRKYRFKIPLRVQRVREGDQWVVSILASQVRQEALQIIYKTYR